MAWRLCEHMLREGVKANDEVLLVPSSGAWVATRGPLRPGLDALAAHLRDAGAGVKIAKALCVCCPDCPSASLEHELTRPSFARVRKYPSRADAGRAFTAGLKRVLAEDVRAVDAAAMSDILLDEQAAREYTYARSVAGGLAGGRASSLKQGSAWLEANGYTKQDYTDDDARAACRRRGDTSPARQRSRATAHRWAMVARSAARQRSRATAHRWAMAARQRLRATAHSWAMLAVRLPLIPFLNSLPSSPHTLASPCSVAPALYEELHALATLLPALQEGGNGKDGEVALPWQEGHLRKRCIHSPWHLRRKVLVDE